MLANIYFCLYGVLLIIGGYMGYQSAGSRVSLVMGVTSGLIVLVGFLLQRKSQKSTKWLWFGISLLLTAVFAIRFIKTAVFMPVGLVLSLSMVGVIVSLLMKPKVSM